MLKLLLAIAAISTGAPFARWAAPAPAIAIAALRPLIASVLQLAAGHRQLRALWSARARDRVLICVAGLLLAAHFGTWIASLQLTSTAASVALVCTNPAFAALLGAVLLGDRVTTREVVGIAIAFAGSAVLAGGDWQAGGKALAGDGLALVGAVCGAGYLVVGRRVLASPDLPDGASVHADPRGQVPLLPYLGAVNAIAGVTLAAIAVVSGHFAMPMHSIVACAGAAMIASFVGHGLLNAAVRTTPTHLVALAVLGEPIGASLITWVAFGEQPPIHAAIGGAIVLAGIAIGFARRPP